MLRRHLPAIATIVRVPALEYRVRRYFGLGSGPLLVELRRAGLCQADIVLCLLRAGTPRSREIIEKIVGRPITVAAACRLVWNHNSQAPTVRRQPIITWVCSDATLRRGTRIAAAFTEFRVGRTLEQLRVRGVSKGDLRRAMRRGWIRVEGV